MKLQKTEELFRDYQMVLYQFAFSSFLEIMLLGNFDEQYLKNIASRIEELAFQYREMYTECYNRIENISNSSVQTVLTGGVAGISKGAGRVISKIPVISKGPVDEALVSAGHKLEDRNTTKTDKVMRRLIDTSTNCTTPFVQSIEAINRIYNEPMDMLFDRENIYLVAA
ncbi:MAG: hypothetical protein LUF92_17560 [Clostridiales bacterium]|nr:hypothetical protein [Clostridiales bacterium]